MLLQELDDLSVIEQLSIITIMIPTSVKLFLLFEVQLDMYILQNELSVLLPRSMLHLTFFH